MFGHGQQSLEIAVEFTNEFRVPADINTTFSILTDVEKVAPCMPGATLEAADGDTYTGVVKVKVGPIQTVYRGTAEVTEIDEVGKRASIRARGKETRGTGTAEANVTATLREEDGETVVSVLSQVDVTGRPAQFGRGIMADVGEQVISQFAKRLQALLEGDEASDESGVQSSARAGDIQETSSKAAGGSIGESQKQAVNSEALDLVAVVGPAAIKRAVPLAAGLAVVLGLIWWLRRR